MAENQKVDLSTLPKGLTKEEFTALPNFKKIRSFFTWAGVVSIVSGIFVLSSIGHISQSILQNGGSLDGLFQMGAVKLNLLFMVVSIVLGILLRRWTKGYTIKQPNMDCQPTEITALMRHRAVFSWAEEGGIPTSGA